MTNAPRSRSKRSRRSRGTPNRSAAPKSTSARLSRRRFMTMLAAGSAALASGVVPAFAANTKTGPAPATPKSATTTRPKLSAAALEDLKQQKTATKAAVEKIRAFQLDYGSDPAFVFRPIKTPRARH